MKEWPLWEVLVRPSNGLTHQHVGSLHAPDAQLALRNARDLYTRRGEGVSLWVVPTTDLVAWSAGEHDPTARAGDHPYPHPSLAAYR
jgi:ring-1,2-phenylacetyl-CoA epoxidase subunit PaaB